MKVIIITPVFNDWESFEQLQADIDLSLHDVDVDYQLLAVNDDSSTPPPPDIGCDVLHLTCNIGHQRAIAIALALVADEFSCDQVIVMDADGEDRPSDIPAMLRAASEKPSAIVVARRDKRSEGAAFKIGYRLYQGLFRLFTGQRLPFGNFCLIPADVVKRIVFQDSLWNHLPATVLRSRFDVVMVPTARGTRYAGQSKMNAGSLVLLGLSAVSVYSDVALLRTLSGSFLLSLLAFIGIAITVSVRVFSELGIPGWASNVVGSMSIIFVQCLFVSIFLLFIVLANRSQRGFIAAQHFRDYVLKVDRSSKRQR